MRKRNFSKFSHHTLDTRGTGKTYASAFAVRELGYKKVLFLVHRNQIAEQAMKSYQKVFGESIKTGMVTGKSHDYDADFIFATVQTLSKTENLEIFPRDYFECCIYDEAHHTSADSYKKVMDYFTPKFTLGMAATPDKRDDHVNYLSHAVQYFLWKRLLTVVTITHL